MTELPSRKHLRLVSAAPEVDPDFPVRPVTRADCANVPRPCPWVSCNHHLLLDVTPKEGVLRVNKTAELPGWPETWSEDDIEKGLKALPFSCALDAAEEGGMVEEDIGEALGITKAAVSLILTKIAVRSRRDRVLRQYE